MHTSCCTIVKAFLSSGLGQLVYLSQGVIIVYFYNCLVDFVAPLNFLVSVVLDGELQVNDVQRFVFYL